MDSRFAYHGTERRRQSGYLALIVVDADCRVKFSFCDGAAGDEASRIVSDDRQALRPEIQTIVRKLMVSGGPEPAFGSKVVRLDDDRALRLSPLVGNEETLYALIVETHRHFNSLARASARFQLTPRQTEVLGLVLEGATAGEIALSLSISEYTAQGYIKSLLSKTGCRNRSAMVAKVLEWRRAHAPGAQGREETAALTALAR